VADLFGSSHPVEDVLVQCILEHRVLGHALPGSVLREPLLDHRGVDRAGINDVDGDPVVPKFLCENLRERDDAGFRGRIRALTWERPDGSSRGNVDDRTLDAALKHPRRCVPGAVDRSFQVDVAVEVEVRFSRFDCRDRPLDTGVVDEAVDGTAGVLRFVESLAHAVAVGDIDLEGRRVDAVLAYRVGGVRRRLQVGIEERHVSAGACDPCRDPSADPLCCTCHDYVPVCQSIVVHTGIVS